MRIGCPFFRIAAVWLSCTLILTGLVAARSLDLETPEDAILAKGFEAYMDGRDKIALSYFEEVVRINPENDAAKMALEKVQIRLEEKDDEARRRREELAEKKVDEGESLADTKDYVGAVDAFHAAIDSVPGYRDAEKELRRLRKDLEKILKKEKLNLSTWAFARGVMAYMDRDWAKAYRIWSQRAEMEPQNVALQNAKERAERKFVTMMMAEREEFLRRGARELYRQGLYQQAKSSWERLLAFNSDDIEALEGKARSEAEILRIKGKNLNKRSHDLLEQGLGYYATQDYRRARDSFTELVSIDPDFATAKDYLAKIRGKLSDRQWLPNPDLNTGEKWRDERPTNFGQTQVSVPNELENLEQRRRELESQIKRNPTDIEIQQKLDRMTKMQEAESERIYKDGLIAYSQGNRVAAMDKWKQVLVISPDHKKAAAALRKARAEEERSAGEVR